MGGTTQRGGVTQMGGATQRGESLKWEGPHKGEESFKYLQRPSFCQQFNFTYCS